MTEFQYKRRPAVMRRLADIVPENDIRVRLLGKVIEKQDSSFILDDGSGKSEIVAEDMNLDFNTNDLIRVFARVLPLEEGFELRAEIIQDMTKLDMDLYKKIHGLE